MIRKGIYSIEEVLREVQFIPKKSSKNSGIKSGKWNKVEFDGEMINMASDRYKVFFCSTTCERCGIEGEYFAMEKHEGDIGYHFNLYAVKDGEEILMTKDHIIPKSLGGKDRLTNYQTMCTECNISKGAEHLDWQLKRCKNVRDVALRAKDRLSRSDNNDFREIIVCTMTGHGCLSIWLDVFRDDSDMIQRFINAMNNGDDNECYKSIY